MPVLANRPTQATQATKASAPPIRPIRERMKPRRAGGVLIAQLLGSAGLDEADDAEDDGDDGRVAEEPQDHGDDPQDQAGGGVALARRIVWRGRGRVVVGFGHGKASFPKDSFIVEKIGKLVNEIAEDGESAAVCWKAGGRFRIEFGGDGMDPHDNRKTVTGADGKP